MDESKAYNPALLFLAGLLTFSLGVIAAVFAALDKTGTTQGAMLGTVLAWASLTALVGTISAGVLQAVRARGGKNKPPDYLIEFAVAAPIVPGMFLAFVCMKLGAKIAGAAGICAVLMKVFD